MSTFIQDLRFLNVDYDETEREERGFAGDFSTLFLGFKSHPPAPTSIWPYLAKNNPVLRFPVLFLKSIKLFKAYSH
jgi:hypothetical protein